MKRRKINNSEKFRELEPETESDDSDEDEDEDEDVLQRINRVGTKDFVKEFGKYNNTINNPFFEQLQQQTQPDKDEEYEDFRMEDFPIMDTVKKCENRSKMSVYNMNDNFIKNKMGTCITKELTRPLREYHQKIVVENKIFDTGQYNILLKVYRKWLGIFMNNYNKNLNLLNEYENSNTQDSDSKHLIIELCKMQRILLTCSKKLELRYGSHPNCYFWYIPGFGKKRISNNEMNILKELPDMDKTCPFDLKHLPISVVLHGNKRIMAYSVKEIMKSIRFIFHNMQIDFDIMVNYKSRVHILYFFELIIARLGGFICMSGREQMFDSINLRDWIGGNSYIANERFRRMVPLVIYILRFLTSSDSFIPGEYVSAKLCLPQNHKIKWNVNRGVTKVSNFFTDLLRDLIGYHNEVLAPFFEIFRRESVFSALIPGCTEYDKLVNVSNDFWSRAVNDTNKKLEVLQGFMIDTYMFLTEYFSGFDKAIESVNNRVYGSDEEETEKEKEEEEEGEVEDKKVISSELMRKYAGMIFREYVTPFMMNIFYVRPGFEKWIKEDTSTMIPNDVKKELLRTKKNQCQFMYPAHVVHTNLYIRALIYWYKNITDRGDFVKSFMILCAELYYGSSTLDKKIQNSNTYPIISQTHPMRYDVLFKMKKYYCNNDIRCAILVWLLILYVHCNGMLRIELDEFDIRKNIEEILLIKVDRRIDKTKRKSGFDIKNTYDLLVGQKDRMSTDEFELKFNPINLKSVSIDKRNRRVYDRYDDKGVNVLKFEGREIEDQEEVTEIDFDEILNLRSHKTYE
jgi:hypothetical protein